MIGLALLGTPGHQTLPAGASSLSDLAMLLDTSSGIGCWWCYEACKNASNLPETARSDLRHPPQLPPDTRSTLRPVRTDGKQGFLKLACMHCSDAVCQSVPDGGTELTVLRSAHPNARQEARDVQWSTGPSGRVRAGRDSTAVRQGVGRTSVSCVTAGTVPSVQM